MRVLVILVLSCVLLSAHASTEPRATLKPFASEREFDELLERWRHQARAALERRRELSSNSLMLPQAAAPGQGRGRQRRRRAGRIRVDHQCADGRRR